MSKQDRIVQDTLKAHNKTIFRKLDISQALFLFIWINYIFAIHPNYIEIYIDSDLKTKKNNYTIMFDKGALKTLLWKYKTMLPKTLLWTIKHMVFIWKPDKVKKDEKKLKSIFKDLSQWNYEYFVRTDNLKILFTSNFQKNHTANILLAYNKIDYKNKEIVNNELREKFEPLVRRYLEFFFSNPFFSEEYHYITELNSVGEKDTSNTPELFNDVFEIGATILWQKFNDKQIIDIHWKKIYYKKNNSVFTPFYIFKIEPKLFKIKTQKNDKNIEEKAKLANQYQKTEQEKEKEKFYSTPKQINENTNQKDILNIDDENDDIDEMINKDKEGSEEINFIEYYEEDLNKKNSNAKIEKSIQSNNSEFTQEKTDINKDWNFNNDITFDSDSLFFE